MKKLQLSILALGLFPLLHQPAAAQSLDPAFVPASIYAPGTVFAVLEQADGKRVVTGAFNRINGSAAPAISRFNTNGTLDAAFQANVGAAAGAVRCRQLSNGQLLFSTPSTPITAGGITRQSLLRLNADGTADASFDVGTGPVQTGVGTLYVDDFLPLPNGQTIAVGQFDQFNNVPAHGIVRLSATGVPDPTFNAGGAGTDGDIESIVALPNGQYLVGGYITSYNGRPCNGVVRLNADGTLDPSFVVQGLAITEILNLVVQPDGRILISGRMFFGTSTSAQGLARLLPDGSLDTSFTPPALVDNSSSYSIYSLSGEAMLLQPDGKIIILCDPLVAGSSVPGVVRLNANGTLDPTFQVGTGANSRPNSLTRLTSGQVLVSGSFTNFSGTPDRALIQLTSTGAVDASFQPVVQTTGSIAAIVRQPDGKLVVGGTFAEINGQPVRRLARFNPDGTLDAAYPTNVGFDLAVVDVALQPDGRVLAATAKAVRRFQADGSPDNSFITPDLTRADATLSRLLLQPDGRIVVGGPSTSISNNSTAFLLRLLPDGSRDAFFAPNTAASSNRFVAFSAMTLQADGKLLVAGRYALAGSTTSTRTIMRLDNSGAFDASFVGSPFVSPANGFVNALVAQPDGKILAGGLFSTYAGTARTNVARLNSNGTLDLGFTPPTSTGTIITLLLQPNNRILMGGTFAGTGVPTNLARLLPDGAVDATFAATAGPNGAVRSLLLQPDGKIALGGSFTALGGVTSQGLARITASGVLPVAAPQAVAERTTAWPVPAHSTLNVAPDATAHAQRLELLNTLGQPVREQLLTSSATTSLRVDTLPVGIYLLRVTYAEGIVTRRVQVQ